MGNTSSSASTPGSPNPGAQPSASGSSTAAAAAGGGSQATSIPRSASQPVGASGVSASAPAERPTFHSGLTPPVHPPSPPPPGTPPLLPHAGHLSPQNPHALSHPQAHDFSKTVVTRLILEAKLAPFYRGLEDFDEDWSLDDIGRTVDELRENDYDSGVSNSVTERMKEDRAPAGGVGSVAKKIGIQRGKATREREEREAVLDREKRAYQNATECPICFLNYPPNINTSRCCQQPICTECFVQIKRSEATLTHLESDPACCPFCMETDFGVIYERPPTPTSTQRSISSSALATSPEGATSGFSQALSLNSEDAELSVGPGMAPKIQETIRRKSVNAKDKQVVTIDEIRPDWEAKLNAVKAAAARKASRRIVMRQVGDRLVPIGYTSARAPGTADFSMSVGTEESGSRRRRGTSGRERDLEELMIMEAMRLSMIDHEEHQRKIVEPAGGSKGSAPGSGAATPTQAESSSSGAMSSFRRRAGTEGSNANPNPTIKEKAASKLFSKFGNRSRSGSSASKSDQRVSFAPDVSRRAGGLGTGSGANSSVHLPSGTLDPNTPNPSSPLANTSAFPPPSAAPSHTSTSEGGSGSALVPIVVTPPADTTEADPPAPQFRVSLDMPPLVPDAPSADTTLDRRSLDTTRAI